MDKEYMKARINFLREELNQDISAYPIENFFIDIVNILDDIVEEITDG